MVTDSSRSAVEEIIIRLNGIRDPKYGSKLLIVYSKTLEVYMQENIKKILKKALQF